MNVFKNISAKTIEKSNHFLTSIFDSGARANYPLDWTDGSELNTFSAASGKESVPEYGANQITYEEMTYETVTSGTLAPDLKDVLKKLKVLNPIWQKINLVRMGHNSDLDIARLCIMVEEGTAGQNLLAVYPG